MRDLVIRGVDAVLPNGAVHADIEIEDGKCVGFAPPGEGAPARHTIEGEGLEAFPGVIDPHVHFRPDRTTGWTDMFSDVAAAAVKGGVTSFVAFTYVPPEQPSRNAVDPFIAMEGRVPADFNLHLVLWPHDDRLAEIPEIAEKGLRSFKLFFAYPDRGWMFDGPSAVKAFRAIKEVGGIAHVHAEDGHGIHAAEEFAKERLGKGATMADFLEAHPARAEAVAVDQVSLWAATVDCPLYVVHLSSALGLDVLRERIALGQDITIETCPHYLALTRDDLTRLGPLAKFAPVPGDEHDNRSLWSGVERGEIWLIGSDHASVHCKVKCDLAQHEGVFAVPHGIPGIETLFPYLYTHAVGQGHLSREQLANLTSVNPARRLGWFPEKGGLRPGADADIVLVDPSEERPVRASEMRSDAGYSAFEGMMLRGWPRTTIRRGEIVFDEGEIHEGGGRFTPTHPTRFGRAGQRGRSTLVAARPTGPT